MIETETVDRDRERERDTHTGLEFVAFHHQVLDGALFQGPAQEQTGFEPGSVDVVAGAVTAAGPHGGQGGGGGTGHHDPIFFAAQGGDHRPLRLRRQIVELSQLAPPLCALSTSLFQVRHGGWSPLSLSLSLLVTASLFGCGVHVDMCAGIGGSMCTCVVKTKKKKKKNRHMEAEDKEEEEQRGVVAPRSVSVVRECQHIAVHSTPPPSTSDETKCTWACLCVKEFSVCGPIGSGHAHPAQSVHEHNINHRPHDIGLLEDHQQSGGFRGARETEEEARTSLSIDLGKMRLRKYDRNAAANHRPTDMPPSSPSS